MDGRARVAVNLRRLRVARGLTQAELAVDAGVDRTYVGGIERREFNPAVDILEKLSTTLGVDIAELFSTADPAGPEQKGMKRGRKSSP